MRVKPVIESMLRGVPPLYRFGSRVYHRVNGQFRTLSPGAPTAIHNAFALRQTDAEVAAVDGDYYEFGIFRGGTFLAAYQTLVEFGLDDVAMWGFDSFEGLPSPTGIDATDTRFFEGQFACSREEVEAQLKKHGMDLGRARFIQGYYEDSLTEALHQAHDFKPVSVALLDCDYYSSTRIALTWLDRYVQPGSILLFDDWFSYGDSDEYGQQRAFAEWQATRPDLRAEHLEDFRNNGRGFVMRAAR